MSIDLPTQSRHAEPLHALGHGYNMFAQRAGDLASAPILLSVKLANGHVQPPCRNACGGCRSRPSELMVRIRGLEPPLPCGNWYLKPARLPIPPYPHIFQRVL